jgi:hypothetical protein
VIQEGDLPTAQALNQPFCPAILAQPAAKEKFPSCSSSPTGHPDPPLLSLPQLAYEIIKQIQPARNGSSAKYKFHFMSSSRA